MGFVHDNQVKLLFVFVLVAAFQHFRQAAVGDKLCLLVDTELLECVFPVVFEGWRIDDQDVGVPAVCLDKPFGNHGGD